jgi:hypothetical protein
MRVTFGRLLVGWTAIATGFALARPASAQAPKPVMRISVDSPTVVAFFSVSQREIDADSGDQGGGLQAALDDFQYYLARAAALLHNAGARVTWAYADTVVLTRLDGSESRVLARDALRIGYAFAGPGKPLYTVSGVMTDVDIVCMAREHLSLRVELSRQDIKCP